MTDLIGIIADTLKQTMNYEPFHIDELNNNHYEIRTKIAYAGTVDVISLIFTDEYYAYTTWYELNRRARAKRILDKISDYMQIP